MKTIIPSNDNEVKTSEIIYQNLTRKSPLDPIAYAIGVGINVGTDPIIIWPLPLEYVFLIKSCSIRTWASREITHELIIQTGQSYVINNIYTPEVYSLNFKANTFDGVENSIPSIAHMGYFFIIPDDSEEQPRIMVRGWGTDKSPSLKIMGCWRGFCWGKQEFLQNSMSDMIHFTS